MEDKKKKGSDALVLLFRICKGRGEEMPDQGENEGEKPSRAADSLWQGPLWNLARQGNKKAYAEGTSVNSAQLTR